MKIRFLFFFLLIGSLYYSNLFDLNEKIINEFKNFDSFSQENDNSLKYKKTKFWYDGTPITVDKVDGIIYKEINNNFYELVLEDDVDVRLFGAKGDGATDDSEAFQKCINYSSAKGKTMYVPKTNKFYLLGCNQFFGDEFSNMTPIVKVALEMKSNLKIVSNKATLKIKSGISSQKKPVPMRMFFSNNFLENIYFNGLILDMNGQNNLISPNLKSGVNNYTQAHILFSGTKSGISAGANNVIIENCEFLNTAGVTCIGLAQSNTQNVKLGQNWTIRNNRFYNNGFDSVDHSSIYAFANNVVCYNNIFDNPKMFNVSGGLVAFEVHGSNIKFYNNQINNYFQGVWVANNWSQPKIENTEITNNKASVSGVFVDFYNGNLEKPPFYPINIINTRIENNIITITDDPVNDAVKQFVRIGSKIHPNNTYILNNNVTSESKSKNVSFVSVVVFKDHVKALENLVIKQNKAKGLGDGVLFYWDKKVDLKNIEIIDNDFGNYIMLKDSHKVDVLGYGQELGKVINLKTKKIKKLQSDNNNRFEINGKNH